MSTWLSKVVRGIDESKCKELRHFLNPREVCCGIRILLYVIFILGYRGVYSVTQRDYVLMDNDMAADNGLNGAWGMELVNESM